MVFEKSLGHLRKLKSVLDKPISYELPLDEQFVALNPLLGKKISLRFTGNIHCVHCGRKTKKSFNQGYCYPCFIKLAQCDSCIIKPELCHYHLGTCREPEWGEQHCMIPHIVYLANSSAIKVGITRASQIPTRWIDQGAIQALPIARVKSRLQSGLLEVIFKQHVADKTHWQAMLKNNASLVDLSAARDRLFDACYHEIMQLQNNHGIDSIQLMIDGEETRIDYPVLNYPTKVSSFNFDKNPLVEGVLMGIKGQYLMLESGVINIRNFTAYEVEFSYA